MRLDCKEESTQNEITAAGSGHPDDYDDTEDDEMEPSNANITSSTNAAPYVPANAYADAIASYVQTAPLPPEAPVGDKYQRLGFWRCRLCTSQKYLNAPPPKVSFLPVQIIMLGSLETCPETVKSQKR